jgi:hypothetical protein
MSVRRFQVVIRGSNGHELDRSDIISFLNEDDAFQDRVIREAMYEFGLNHIFMIGDSITIEEVE